MAHISDLIATDIDSYLAAHEQKELLRFITCGSVDDGKSTLIGRMLYESHMLFDDHLTALEADSKKVGTQDGEMLGYAVAISGDGNYIAVGSPFYNDSSTADVGRYTVMYLVGATWTLLPDSGGLTSTVGAGQVTELID